MFGKDKITCRNLRPRQNAVNTETWIEIETIEKGRAPRSLFPPHKGLYAPVPSCISRPGTITPPARALRELADVRPRTSG
ncbi:unnamed protein product [Pieris macdunnoughi]|uniref:Uncharacterized protein n=1 Tax=Pieris macdunnoughi TaxID=345717 RepID=A0A821XDZ9_9NEOP|nr:unnamed protein product [Pieris macdunnoughi]